MNSGIDIQFKPFGASRCHSGRRHRKTPCCSEHEQHDPPIRSISNHHQLLISMFIQRKLHWSSPNTDTPRRLDTGTFLPSHTERYGANEHLEMSSVSKPSGFSLSCSGAQFVLIFFSLTFTIQPSETLQKHTNFTATEGNKNSPSGQYIFTQSDN